MRRVVQISGHESMSDNREAGLDHTFDSTASLNATTLGWSVASISASPQGLIFGSSFHGGCYFSAGYLVRPANAI
jgi:hypothetical protein